MSAFFGKGKQLPRNIALSQFYCVGEPNEGGKEETPHEYCKQSSFPLLRYKKRTRSRAISMDRMLNVEGLPQGNEKKASRT